VVLGRGSCGFEVVCKMIGGVGLRENAMIHGGVRDQKIVRNI